MIQVPAAIVRGAAIAHKELLQLKRDRMTLAMMLMLPVIQLLLFGYAINTDVRNMPTVVYDQDQTRASRDLARRMAATGFYRLRGEVSSYADIDRLFRAGEARVALVVPPRFAADLARPRPAHAQLVVDGSDPQIVATATSTAASLVSGGGTIALEPLIRYNPDLRTAVYVVPGLIGVILTMTMVMLTAMALARERERGTLEQLIVTPVRRVELVVGKIVPYVAIGYVQMTLVLLLGRFVFDVPIAGSLILLFALASVFIAANLAIGLFFSTVARTQQQAMQMSFFFLLPNFLLSGFMFPFEGMPTPARALSQALPLTHFLRIVRGVVLKGSHLADLASELFWLVGILGVLVALTSLRFKKKLV